MSSDLTAIFLPPQSLAVLHTLSLSHGKTARELANSREPSNTTESHQ